MTRTAEPLGGKVILIAGTDAGAAALAQGLHDQGATLALTGPDARALGAVALPLNALPLPADLAVAGDAQSVVAEVIETFGRLDGVVVAQAAGAGLPALAQAAAAVVDPAGALVVLGAAPDTLAALPVTGMRVLAACPPGALDAAPLPPDLAACLAALPDLAAQVAWLLSPLAPPLSGALVLPAPGHAP